MTTTRRSDAPRGGDPRGPGTADADERDRLIAANLELATHLARRFSGRGVPSEDLHQVAYLALVVAADRFEPQLGYAFPTFATWTIIGELKHHFRDHGWAVKAPRALQELSIEVRRTVEELTQRLGRVPTVREIARTCARPEEDVLRAMEVGGGYRASSLDATGVDVEGGDEGIELLEGNAELASYLRRLSPRDRLVLHLRFVEELSQSDIAYRVGLSQVQVSRLLRRSLEALRDAYRDGA